MILRRIFFLGLGIIAALLAAELLLRVLPTPSALISAKPDSTWPVRHLLADSTYRSSSGWAMDNVQSGRINNRGYVAPFDYRKGASVGVVIGDSYVEGMMNPYATMLQARLAQDMARRPDSIYNFGTSGVSLPHYLGIARLAGRDYRPEFAVVSIVARDFIEGFNSDPGVFRWSKDHTLIRLTPDREPSRLAKVTRSLALVRYARINLKATPALITKSGFEEAPKPICGPATLSVEDKRLLQGWVDQLPKALKLQPAKVVLVLDADRPAIYLGKPIQGDCADRDNRSRTALAAMARQAGMKIVDTAPLFQADWALHHIPFDRAPLDAHWSPYAHALIAHAVARTLKD